MSSPFILTIDWLSFTLPSGTVKETMAILEGEWTKSQAGFRGYPLSWISVASDRGVGKLGTGAPRSPLEVHVDLSAGIISAWPTSKVRTVLQWILDHQGTSPGSIVPWTIGLARFLYRRSRQPFRQVNV